MPETGKSPATAIWGDDLPNGHPGFLHDLKVGADAPGSLEFGPLLEIMREVQDRFVGSLLPTEVEVELTSKLTEFADILGKYQVGESARVDGRRPDLPGRGSLLIPPWLIEERTETTIKGRVTFRRFHLGGNGAAHGGTLPLLFDDLLGKVVNHEQPGVARTVNISIDYRRITPIGEELLVDGRLDKIDGRKRWASARLKNAAGELLADTTALFIELKPGQQ